LQQGDAELRVQRLEKGAQERNICGGGGGCFEGRLCGDGCVPSREEGDCAPFHPLE